ncbi:hypothetical protein D3C80_2020460 [compost metagenome]
MVLRHCQLFDGGRHTSEMLPYRAAVKPITARDIWPPAPITSGTNSTGLPAITMLSFSVLKVETSTGTLGPDAT